MVESELFLFFLPFPNILHMIITFTMEKKHKIVCFKSRICFPHFFFFNKLHIPKVVMITYRYA